jgi:DNA-binding MarR family transcriptional regulator
LFSTNVCLTHILSKVKAPNVANLLGALAVVVSDGVAEAVAHDHTLGDATALLVLEKYSDVSVEFLRVPLGLSHSGCVRLVDRLVLSGLVERRDSPSQDGRLVALRLTRKGRDVAAQAGARREEALARVASVLSAEELVTFGVLIAKIVDGAVVAPRGALRTCRLCDYSACLECPMHKFAADGTG